MKDVIEREELGMKERFLADFAAERLKVLIILLVPQLIGSGMTQRRVLEVFPQLLMPGLIVSGATLLAYGFILRRMSLFSARYRLAGNCILVCAAITFLQMIPFEGYGGLLLISVTSLSAVFGYMAEFQEYNAHADLLAIYNQMELSQKWRKLWKRKLISLGIILVSIPLVIGLRGVGVITFAIGFIALFVVTILAIVYLFRTAFFFSKYNDDSSVLNENEDQGNE